MRNYRNIASNNSYLGALASGMSQAEIYRADAYSDEGNFTYFYIDFKKDMAPFSLGMLIESIVIVGATNVVLPITGFEKINNKVFKIYCNIVNQEYIIVSNKKESWLKFSNNAKVDAFTTMFNPAGTTRYIKLAYAYELVNMGSFLTMQVMESCAYVFNPTANYEVSESATLEYMNGITANENVVVTPNPS